MSEQIQDIHLRNRMQRKQWQNFLVDRGIEVFADQEIDVIDDTIGLFDEDGQLVGTGSIAGDVIKYIAVCNKGAEAGSRFNTVVSELVSRLAQQGVFHIMVFTKPQYTTSFEHVGFTKLADSDQGVLLEKGDPNIQKYLAAIPKKDAGEKIAGIVMNANPFTLGHRYLVETAAKENDWVYVFVVNQDASLFKTEERVALVEAGTKDLENVIVVNGGSYMVSYATFPAYFISSPDAVVDYQTTLDARLFKHWIAEDLHIQTRYLGSEPYSHTTDLYNQALQRELPPEVAVKIIPRKELGSGDAISATSVRQALSDGDVNKIENRVPITTYQFIVSHQEELEARIQKGNKNGD